MNEKARKLLEGYIPSKARIKVLSEELAAHSGYLDDTWFVALSGEHSDDSMNMIGEIEGAVMALTMEICNTVYQHFFAYAAISSISDPEIKLVLELHYLTGKTLQEIADDIHYCLTTIKKLHRCGLSAVEQYLQENEYEQQDIVSPR